MLTGDSASTADLVAKTIGIDTVHSELLPADKVEEVEKLLAKKSDKEKLAFVGDGIMMHQYSLVLILVLRWVVLVVMLPLKQQMLF